MSPPSEHERLARALAAQALGGRPVRLPERAAGLSIAEAYAVQAAGAALRAAGGERFKGYKIAATTPAAREAVGTASPAYARLFSSGDVSARGRIAARAGCRLGVECELALILSRDVTPGDDPVAAIGQVAIGCEIVEDRYAGIGAAGPATLVADNFAQRAYALGAAVPFVPADLPANVLRASVREGARELATGRPGEGTADPFEALRWLAARLAEHGARLGAGDIVLTGAIAPPLWVDAPCALTLTLHPVGRLDISIDPAAEEPDT